MREEIMSNIIFIIRIFFYLYAYRQISGVKLAKKWYVIIPITIRMMFFVIPAIAYFVAFLCPLIVSLVANKFQNRLLDIFYGLYPTIVENLLDRLLAFYILPFIGISTSQINSNPIFSLIITLLIFPIYAFLVKLLRLDFKKLQVGLERNFLNRYLISVNLSMAVYFILIQTSVLLADFIGNEISIEFRIKLAGVYGILFIFFLIYTNSSFKNRLEQELLDQKERQLDDLSQYSHHIEKLYQEIRSFRHDYANILVSLKSGIDSRDIDKVKSVYDEVLANTGTYIQSSRFDIAKLVNIKDDAIKSVLSAKVLEAQNQQIEVHLEIDDRIDEIFMETLDFVRVISILCDNAIEAAKKAQAPHVSIAIINDKSKITFFIENSTVEEQVDISKIFESGFSTNGEHRGIGLANLRQILSKYPIITLNTSSRNGKFRQVLKLIN